MRVAHPRVNVQEPEILDPAVLAAIDKGVKSLDEGKSVPAGELRHLVRERYQAWLKITQDLHK